MFVSLESAAACATALRTALAARSIFDYEHLVAVLDYDADECKVLCSALCSALRVEPPAAELADGVAQTTSNSADAATEANIDQHVIDVDTANAVCELAVQLLHEADRRAALEEAARRNADLLVSQFQELVRFLELRIDHR